MDKNFVLDTSAFLTIFLDEQGSDVVQKIITQAKSRTSKIFISFLTMTELYYRVYRNEGEDAANEVIALVRSLPVEVVQSNDILNLSAGRIKATHKLSIADAYIAATALLHKASLVHKDPEFESLSKEISMISLPYKHAN